jgi:ParB family chromosome partitioning protein
MNPPMRAIDEIEVGFRYRKDLGDLRSLADSIETVRLLHPIVVTPEGRLIAGQRRLEACRLLGWQEIPVTVIDLYQAARGEAHENFVRKDLLPSEIVALKRAIEPLERRAARQRQGSRPGQNSSLSGSGPDHHRTGRSRCRRRRSGTRRIWLSSRADGPKRQGG